jgi:hypothetical protein
MVVIAVQSAFFLKKHQNNFFKYLKNYFDISTSKRSEKIKKLNKSKFKGTWFAPRSQTGP